MTKLGLFAYGEMGDTAFQTLLPRYDLIWIVLPPQNVQTLAEQRTQKLAKKNKVPVINENNILKLNSHISNKTPDIVLICSFNKILSQKTLSLTKFINVHLGDLPKYRGRANVNWAIINDEKETVISIHKVTPDLDGGNIYAKFPIKILDHETVGDIYEKINSKLELKLGEIIEKVLKGNQGKPQKGSPTYCATRMPNDGLIDFSKTTKEISNFIRALTMPYPGAFTFYDMRKMIVWSARIPKNPKKFVGRIPGRVINIHRSGVEVLTNDSSIIIENISYNGKEQNASEVVKSVKTTLGVDFVSLYENLIANER